MTAAIQDLWHTSGAGLVVTSCTRLRTVKCILSGDRLIAPMAFTVRVAIARTHGKTLCHISTFGMRTCDQLLLTIHRHRVQDRPTALVPLSLHHGFDRMTDRLRSVVMLDQ